MLPLRSSRHELLLGAKILDSSCSQWRLRKEKRRRKVGDTRQFEQAWPRYEVVREVPQGVAYRRARRWRETPPAPYGYAGPLTTSGRSDKVIFTVADHLGATAPSDPS
jgi:hypothetical protein